MKSHRGNIHLTIIILPLSEAGKLCWRCIWVCVCMRHHLKIAPHLSTVNWFSFSSQWHAQHFKLHFSCRLRQAGGRRHSSNYRFPKRMREAKQRLFLSQMSGNGQGGEHRETLALIVSSRASGSSDRKDGSVEFLLACACMFLCTQMQWMTFISLVLALQAAMPCSNEVTYKAVAWLHCNILADMGVWAALTPDTNLPDGFRTPNKAKKDYSYKRNVFLSFYS